MLYIFTPSERPDLSFQVRNLGPIPDAPGFPRRYLIAGYGSSSYGVGYATAAELAPAAN